MSLKEFVEKLDQIQASFSTHIPLVIINSDYKVDKGIVIFGKKGWLRINDPVPIMINYGALILLDTPKNYMVGIYRSANGGRKIKSSSPSKSQKALNTSSKINKNHAKQNNNPTQNNNSPTQQDHNTTTNSNTTQ